MRLSTKARAAIVSTVAAGSLLSASSAQAATVNFQFSASPTDFMTMPCSELDYANPQNNFVVPELDYNLWVIMPEEAAMFMRVCTEAQALEAAGNGTEYTVDLYSQFPLVGPVTPLRPTATPTPTPTTTPTPSPTPIIIGRGDSPLPSATPQVTTGNVLSAQTAVTELPKVGASAGLALTLVAAVAAALIGARSYLATRKRV